MRQRNSKKNNNKLNGINTWYTLINIKSTNLHPVLFHVDCRSAMFMFGYIILFDIAGVIIIPLQSWSQHSVGQAVTVCRQNPQGDPWKELHFHFRCLLDQRLYFAAQSVFSDCKTGGFISHKLWIFMCMNYTPISFLRLRSNSMLTFFVVKGQQEENFLIFPRI